MSALFLAVFIPDAAPAMLCFRLVRAATWRSLRPIRSKLVLPLARGPWAARLNALNEPRIINWAAHTDDLAAIAQKAAAAGIAMENPREGSRARPDGKILRWKSFGLKEDFDGVLPFFIEWSTDSIHPSQDAPAGCTLQQFFVESPDAKDVRSVASKLGLNLDARPGKQPLLSARIAGKKGEFELS